MKTPKLFGIVVMVLLAVTLVSAAENETMLNELLDSYRTQYSDGSFNVHMNGISTTQYVDFMTPPADAGSSKIKFSISGTKASSPYRAIATLYRISTLYGDRNGNVIETVDASSPTNISFDFDGNYYDCADYGDGDTYTFDVDLKIYQENILYYQNNFNYEPSCLTGPIAFGFISSKNITTIGSPEFEKLNLTLKLYFVEKGNYTVGAYISDNKSAAAYAQTKANVAGGSYNLAIEGGTYGLGGSAFYIKKPISIIFNSTQLKDFELNNEKIILKGISVNGKILDIEHHLNLYNYGDGSIEEHNKMKFSTSNFSFDDIYITSYSFDKTHKTGNKLKELGVVLDAINVVSTYDAELSLENIYGETIATKTGTINSPSTTIWFNGTDIYNSKINGPYRIGFIRISEAGNEVFYKTNKGNSGELSYLNFTTPPMADLKINDSDVVGNKDINVTIYNLGEGDAVGITLSLFDSNAVKIKEIILSNISAKSSYFYKFQDVNLPGAFVFADFANSIEETNESNNLGEAKSSGITPASIISVQPDKSSMIIEDGHPLQFNVSATGTTPKFKWFLNGILKSNSSNYIFNPTYYDEGQKTLKINVSNSNGSEIFTWKVNVTPNAIGIFAYAYNQNAKVANSTNIQIDANVTFKDITLTANETVPAAISLSTNKEYNVTYSADGRQPFATKIFFDRRLFSCAEGQSCVFTNTYNTNCIWGTISWACTLTKGAFTDYFRMYPNPRRVNINAYLARS